MKRRNLIGTLMGGLISLAILAMLSPVNAQSFFGSIVGTVTDSSGGVVPNATVTITNVSTNEKHTVKSGSAGEYRVVDLVPANYRVDVEAANFKRFVQEGIPVQVANTIRVDAKLQVGATTETIQVTSAIPLLQTESGSQSSAVEGKVVEEMPLNGRNTMNLIALTPGVVPGNSTAGSAQLNAGNHTTTTGFGNYSIAGGQNGYASHYIDGAPNNVLGQNTVLLIPTQDATQEFRVATSAVSAEYGRFGGGLIEMTTKSGANSFHGSAYEYFRNTVLNANAFFSKNQGLPRGKWNQNQYGVQIGGPIKTDKAFFMFSWEDFHLREGLQNNTNMPTQAQRNGVFAKTLLNGSKITINDPGGYCASKVPGGIQFDPIAQTYTIPQGCMDPTGMTLLNYFALPTQPNNPSFNFPANPVIGNFGHQYTGRVDYNLTSKQRVFGRYTYGTMNDQGIDLFAHTTPRPSLRSVYSGEKPYTHQAVLGDTYTINANTIADLRLSYGRQTLTNVSDTYNSADLSQFGPAYVAMAPFMTFHSQPNIATSGNNALYLVVPEGAVQLDKYNTYAINGSLTRITGKHALKFGLEARLSQFNSVANNPQYAGLATFNNNIVGDELAALEMGIFTQDQIFTVIPTTAFNYSYGFYGTDTWKVTNNLTVNIGVRWELPGAMAEKKDRTTVLLPNTIDPATGYRGTEAIVNSTLWPSRSVEPVRHNLFSPRFSFAERIGNASVVRGGYGLVYLSPDLSGGVLPAYGSQANSVATTSINTAGQKPAFLESNPFPTGIIQPAGRKGATVTPNLLGQIVWGAVPSNNYPYIQQFNLAVSRQWKGGWMTEVAGVGTKGTHLPINAQNGTPPTSLFGLNEIPNGSYDPTTGLALTGPSAGKSLTTKTSCAAYPQGGNNVLVGQCLKPYPQYQDFQDWTHNTGNSTYRALYATLQKRFGSGGTINANYVWFKSIDDVLGYQDWYNRQSARSVSNWDVPQRAVISYVLDLPFGKNQKFAHFSNGVADAMVSGWTVNGISTFQSGAPLAFTVNGGNSLSQNFAAGTIRANLAPGCNLRTSGSRWDKYIAGLNASTLNNGYFNASCVTAPGSFQFGNAPRNYTALRGMGIENYDFSVLKSTPIKEKAEMQFRIEAFNLMNRTQFSNPSTAVGNKNFDKITAQANNPRLLQASLRIKF